MEMGKTAGNLCKLYKYIQFLTLYILMDFPIHADSLSIGLPILHFKGSKLEFSVLFRSVNVCFNLRKQ